MRTLPTLIAAVSFVGALHAADGLDVWPRSALRPIISMDGKWFFRTDPDQVGEGERWFNVDVPFADSIRVPGCWDAQGFGEPTDKVRSNYVGQAWYRLTVRVPRDWRGKGLYLHVGGVHRYADVWVNGEYMKRHVGYVTPFEVDLSGVLKPGEGNTVAIRVDSRQDWSIDALTGAFDIIDYMDVNWGGIWHHVWLEARDSAYIDSAFVRPSVRDSRADVDVECHSAEDARRELRVDIVDPHGRTVASESRSVTIPAGGSVESFALPVPEAKLWSPNHPWLYRIRARLSAHGEMTDEWEDRFGMREIEIRGPDIYLNGNRTFLHGYGDDTIYPETIVAPADHEVFRERFAKVKAFGLSYVRHHSTVPIPEYFDIADEAGVLVQPELPIAYRPFLDRGLQSEAAMRLYRETWEGMIRRHRNHPSVFGWCMGNEMYGGNELADELYDAAKRLDPTRPVYDSDGAEPTANRRTLDVVPAQFDVAVIPVLDHANKHAFAAPPPKPIISHEMGNFTTYPSLNDIRLLRHVMKPFWLEEARTQVAQRGLLDEVPLWARNSSLLQAACFKLEIEDLRWSPYSDGHALWLFQDYWTGSSGLLNYYYQVKGVGPEFYRPIIADTLLLARLPDFCFEEQQDIRVPVAVSDFGEESLAGRSVRWDLLRGGQVLASGGAGALSGEKGLCTLGEIGITLPRVSEPVKLALRLSLDDDGDVLPNTWPLWVFPRTRVPQPREGTRLIRRLTSEALSWVAEGGRAMVTRPEELLPSETVTFESAWWKGSPGADSHVGTVIYDRPAMSAFPHEGWCDLQFLRLQHNRPALLLDGLPLRAGTLIRAVDCHTGNRDKALMIEARIGRGAIVATTLNLSREALRTRPEARWLARCLLDYIASPAFAPTCELRVEDLKQRIGESPELSGMPRIEGFARLVSHEGEVTREERYLAGGPLAYVVRGTDGRHAIEWETAPVPADPTGDRVCFAFSGGLGWISEPPAPFTLRVDDLPPIEFDVVQRSAEWTSADGRARLLYAPRSVFGPDSLGVFYLIVPADAIAPGRACRIRVEAPAAGSHRWMIVHPRSDVWADEE